MTEEREVEEYIAPKSSILTDFDVSDVITDTIEAMWHSVKAEIRGKWIETLLSLAQEKGWDKEKLSSAMKIFCTRYAETTPDKDAHWLPKLYAVVKYLKKHVVDGTCISDSKAAWMALHDCPLCVDGVIYAIFWKNYPMRYFAEEIMCNCPKGRLHPERGGAKRFMTIDELQDLIESGEVITIIPRAECVPTPDKPNSLEFYKKQADDRLATASGIPF